MDPVVPIVLRLLLTGVLLMALLAKLRDYPRFREVVLRYQLVSPRLTGAACLLVLLWESAAIVGLWTWHEVGAALAAALFAIYASVIAANLLRGRTHIDCGCEWGGGEPASAVRLTAWLPTRNLALVLAALATMVPVSERPLGYLDYGLIALAASFFATAFLALDRALRQWLALRPGLTPSRRLADV